MGDWRSRVSKYLRRAFGSAKHPPSGRASGHSNPDLRREQSSQQAASWRSRLLGKLKWRSPFSLPLSSPPVSWSPMIQPHNSTADQNIVAPTSQSLVAIASIPTQSHGPCSERTANQTHEPSLHDPPPLPTGGSDPGSPPPSDIQCSSSMGANVPTVQIWNSQPEPIANENPTCPSTYTPPPSPDVVTDSSSAVWAKTLTIAENKLRENNLPQLDSTNLTSQSAKENIRTIIQQLNTLQDDDKKNQWSYTWRGKKVTVIVRLGRILQIVERYAKVVDAVVQSNPQVSSLVWAGVSAIMRVRISF